jgi:hypothetical protein
MAILALEEAAVIARDIATSHPAAAARLLEQADEKLSQAAAIRAVFAGLKPFTFE